MPKIRRSSDRLIVYMEIPYLEKTFYWDGDWSEGGSVIFSSGIILVIQENYGFHMDQ